MEYDVSMRQAYLPGVVGEEGTNQPIGEMHDHLARLKTGLA